MMFLTSRFRRPASLGGHVLAFLPLVALLGLGGCQQVPQREIVAPEPLAAPGPEVTAGATPYRVSPELSDVRILAYRGGPLAKFGHSHVISAGTVYGEVYLHEDFHRSRFKLTLPVKDFEADPPAMLRDEGEEFASERSAEAIAGTTKNLLGAEILDAEQYPEVRIESVKLLGPEWGPDITLAIELRGVTRQQTVPVAIERCDDELIATGVLTVVQSDYGITPFSALGGGLQVQDALKLRFRIVAERVG